MPIERPAVVWLIPLVLTVHNAEEAVAFRRYWPDLPTLLPIPVRSLAARFPYADMLGVLVALSLLGFLLALIVQRRPANRFALWLLLALVATLGLNALWHVAVAAVVFRGYAPGLFTAVALNAPVAVYCFTLARREQWLSPAALRSTVPAALILHGPAFLALLWAASIVSK